MFLIAVKRIKDQQGNPLKVHEWKYVGYDDVTGSYSKDYPPFGSIANAIEFTSPEEAVLWWRHNKRDFAKELDSGQYSIDSLGVMKVTFNKVFSLT